MYMGLESYEETAAFASASMGERRAGEYWRFAGGRGDCSGGTEVAGGGLRRRGGWPCWLEPDEGWTEGGRPLWPSSVVLSLALAGTGAGKSQGARMGEMGS